MGGWIYPSLHWRIHNLRQTSSDQICQSFICQHSPLCLSGWWGSPAGSPWRPLWPPQRRDLWASSGERLPCSWNPVLSDSKLLEATEQHFQMTFMTTDSTAQRATFLWDILTTEFCPTWKLRTFCWHLIHRHQWNNVAFYLRDAAFVFISIGAQESIRGFLRVHELFTAVTLLTQPCWFIELKVTIYKTSFRFSPVLLHPKQLLFGKYVPVEFDCK